jgi:hypothetical protein
MKIKAIVLAIVLSLSAGLAMAQYNYPTNPTPAGLQNTPYSNSQFLAAYNGTVSTRAVRENTSTETIYESFDHSVFQAVVVRFVDHDIAVDQTSSDFYADNDSVTTPITNRSTGSWGGHPYTYAYRVYTDDAGNSMSKRQRSIIVSSREVIFIEQITPASYNDQNEWLDFEYSLRIK